jgi:hypothetical protein
MFEKICGTKTIIKKIKKIKKKNNSPPGSLKLGYPLSSPPPLSLSQPHPSPSVRSLSRSASLSQPPLSPRFSLFLPVVVAVPPSVAPPSAACCAAGPTRLRLQSKARRTPYVLGSPYRLGDALTSMLSVLHLVSFYLKARPPFNCLTLLFTYAKNRSVMLLKCLLCKV